MQILKTADDGGQPPECPHISRKGRVSYVEDGWYEFDGQRYCILIPNGHLEDGEPLETYQPKYRLRWDIMDDYQFTSAETELADGIRQSLGKFCVFYLGPERGNTKDGMNRNAIWKPQDWVRLGRRFTDLGYKVVIVGAEYDHSYWKTYLRYLVYADGQDWLNLIGKLDISATFAVIKRANFIVGYQCGLPIASEYMGVPTALWWRAADDSISPVCFFAYDEREKDCWAHPRMVAERKHLGLIYGRQTADQVADMIAERGW